VMFRRGAEYVISGRRANSETGSPAGRALREKWTPVPCLAAAAARRVHPRTASGVEYSVQRAQHDLYLESGSAAQEKPAVLQPSYVCESTSIREACGRDRRTLQAFDLIEGESETALALRWRIPSYERMRLAQAFAADCPIPSPSACPLRRWTGHCADSRPYFGTDARRKRILYRRRRLWDFDYIDLGASACLADVPSPSNPGISETAFPAGARTAPSRASRAQSSARLKPGSERRPQAVEVEGIMPEQREVMGTNRINSKKDRFS